MGDNFTDRLKPFVLEDVEFTGVRIDAGAYGCVEEVAIPGALCAAKKIHDFFQKSRNVSDSTIRSWSQKFLEECELMSTLRHPHIVQFIGVCLLPDSRLPALVMEKMLMSLHDLLAPDPPPDEDRPVLPLILKFSILQDVAGGLTYLHKRSPPVIHRDLSARNVLLNSGMVAKIADLGVSQIVYSITDAFNMSMVPGASVYMPPEALEMTREETSKKNEKGQLKYSSNIDVFSFGVLAIFALCENFPWRLPAQVYEKDGKECHRNELERRRVYVDEIYEKHPELHRENHPLIQMIQGCLQQFPRMRLNICGVVNLLERARDQIVLDESTSEILVNSFKTHMCNKIKHLQPIGKFNAPYGIAINSYGELIISEWASHRVSAFNIKESTKKQTFEALDSDKMRYPAGIAVDNDDNVFVTSRHKLQKFNNTGMLVKSVGKEGREKSEFVDPRGLAIYDGNIFVTDRGNHCIQVFDLDLNFVRSIGSNNGEGKGKFSDPFDVKFDGEGRMYVAEYGNRRVQVLDSTGQHINNFGGEILGSPTGLCVVNGKVFVSDFAYDHVTVFDTNGQHISTIASRGTERNDLRCPYCITSLTEGEKVYIYVCDFGNNKVHVFDCESYDPVHIIAPQ